MASPAKVLPTLNPAEAGRRVRGYAKVIHRRLALGAGGALDGAVPSLAGMSESLGLIGGYMETVLRTNAAHERLLEAAKTRKTSEIVDAALEYRKQVRVQNDTAAYYYSRLYERLQRYVDLSSPSPAASKMVSDPFSGEAIPLVEAAQRLVLLAQSLPTHDDLPSAESQDTIIRGIVAILRAHSVPGSQDLSHSKAVDALLKEVQNGGSKPATEQPAWATAGSSVTFGESDPDEDDDPDENYDSGDDDGDDDGDSPEPSDPAF